MYFIGAPIDVPNHPSPRRRTATSEFDRSAREVVLPRETTKPHPEGEGSVAVHAAADAPVSSGGEPRRDGSNRAGPSQSRPTAKGRPRSAGTPLPRQRTERSA